MAIPLFVYEVIVQPVMAGESSNPPFTKLACAPWLARSAPPSTNVPARSTVPQVRVSAPHDRFMTFLTAILVVMVLAHRTFNAEGYACVQAPQDLDTKKSATHPRNHHSGFGVNCYTRSVTLTHKLTRLLVAQWVACANQLPLKTSKSTKNYQNSIKLTKKAPSPKKAKRQMTPHSSNRMSICCKWLLPGVHLRTHLYTLFRTPGSA